ncbi:MAG: hypothetical protein K5839_05665, partial [Treponemataceae bacterium]|nr:hypothetical protein [Treponemataceae bacterium]
DKCLEIMQDQITNFGVLNEGYNIYLLSDLSPASSDTFDSDHNYSLINLNSVSSAAKLTICGYDDKVYTINE